MNATIFIEGGARDSKNLRISCQRAFRKLLERMGLLAYPRPRLIACGGRDEVYAKFCTEHAQGTGGLVAMWIDSEEPVGDLNRTWEHLQGLTSVASWPKPAGAGDEQVMLMTVSMETWIAADRNALRAYFGQGLNENQLPPLQIWRVVRGPLFSRAFARRRSTVKLITKKAKWRLKSLKA